MTTVDPPRSVPERDAGRGVVAASGERLRRLQERKRLLREELFAVLVLFVAFAATVVILATQWLGSGPSAAGAAPALPAHPPPPVFASTIPGGPT